MFNLNGDNLEEVMNSNTVLGSPRSMGENLPFYHYYYSVRTSKTEYETDVEQLRSPSWLTPTEFAIGGTFGGYFLSVEGNVWGHFKDLYGDYAASNLRLNLQRDGWGLSLIYAHFQRSAYVASYPVDTGGGTVVVDFYEEWIYRDGFGFEIRRKADNLTFRSGFINVPISGVSPVFAGFDGVWGRTRLSVRQVAFWSSPILPPRLTVRLEHEILLGRKKLLLGGYSAIVMKAGEVLYGRRLPIILLRAKYVYYSRGGEMNVGGRVYLTDTSGAEVGGEAYLGYMLATLPMKPEVTLGVSHTPEVKAPYVGLTLRRFPHRLRVFYVYPRSISIGVEVGYVGNAP